MNFEMYSSFLEKERYSKPSKRTSASHGDQDQILFSAIQSGRASDALKFFDHIREKKDFYRQKTLDQSLILACRHGRKFIVQILLAHGANMETRDEDGNTPLLICAEKGFTDIALVLVDKGADINSYNKDGDTALLLSITTSGDYRLVEKLLKTKYELKFGHRNNNGCTALSKAFEVLDFSLLQLFHERLIEDFKRNLKGSRKQTQHDKTAEIAHSLGLDLIYSTLKDKKNSYFKKAVFERNLRITELLLCTIPKTCGSEISIVNDFIHFLNKNHEEIDESVLDIVHMLLNTKSLKSECDISLEEAVEIGDLKLIELLCQHITHEYFLNSPLISAIKIGRCDIIQMLIKYGANLSDTMFMGYAIQYGQIDCAKFLHERGAPVNVTDAISVAVNSEQANSLLLMAELFKQETRKALQESGTHILFEAVDKGNEEMIRILIDIGADVNTIFKGKTVLMAAKDSHVIELLVKLGADVNKVVNINGESDTALSYLLKECLWKTRDLNGNRLEIVNTIIKNSVDLNKNDSFGDTPLMLAVRIPNFSEVVRLLLHSGADVSRQNKEEKTALHFAVEYGSVEDANLLLEYKADVNVKCIQGKTPLLIAVEKGFLETAKVLLENKADVNTKSVNYQSPLMVAVARSNIAMIKLLIENDATIDDEDNNGETALFRVASHHQVDVGEVVKILAEAGACLDHQNKEGQTSLMLAAKHKNVNLVNILCESGADVNIVNTIKKETALSLLTNKANYYCDLDIIRTLINNGANISYVAASFVNMCIIKKEWNILRTVISLGLGPYDLDLENVNDDYLMAYSEYGTSPLETALIKGHTKLAKYFNDIWFLTESDTTALFSGFDLYEMLLMSGDQCCLEFFESYLTQPMSLQKLSFVVVSSAIGAEQGREERVKKLKLPAFLENKLLFKHALDVEIEPEVDTNIRDKNKNSGLGHLFKDFIKMYDSEIGLNEYLPYIDDNDDYNSD